MWVVGIGTAIITGYIAYQVIFTCLNPPKIDWRNVTDIGAPLPINPLALLTIIDIILLSILTVQLISTLKKRPE